MPSRFCSSRSCSTCARSITSKRLDRCSSVVIWSAARDGRLFVFLIPPDVWILNGGTPTFGLLSPRLLGGGAYLPVSAVNLSFDAEPPVLAHPATQSRPATRTNDAPIRAAFTVTSGKDRVPWVPTVCSSAPRDVPSTTAQRPFGTIVASPVRG